MILSTIPESGYLRLWQIIGRKPTPENPDKPRKNKPQEAIQAIIPVSKSHWWDGVRKGIYPAPIHLGLRVTVWSAEDIRALIERIESRRNTK
jgi:predicted DNA-binding transcriptional regulator AlpA